MTAELDGLTLARAVVAHFADRRHQPLLDSERALREMARAILVQAAPVEAQTADVDDARSSGSERVPRTVKREGD